VSIPIHTLLIFQRLKEGSGFQRRVITLNYQHTIAAQGGFDTMSCDIAVRSQGEGQNYLNNYLGCFVQAFADNPVEPIWEGLINRITFNEGNVSYSIGLDEMANRLSVTFTGAANALTQGVVADNTASQNIYGIKQDQIEFGPDTSAGTHRGRLRDTQLAERAFPQTSITQGGGQSNLVHFECIGIFHTLEWDYLFTAAPVATNTQFDTRITATLLPGIANGATFFDNTDVSQISVNAATTPNQNRMSYWEKFLQIAEAGDASNYWVIGILPTNWQTKKRVMYYRQSNAAIEYTARQADGLRIRNLYGRIVPAWTVRPDRAVRVTDVLVGYNSAVTTDPRETYIFNIQYDANTQNVQYFGADDTRAIAAYMVKRGFRPNRRYFGSTIRTIAT
jgi:hypothetical protein